MKKIFITGGAGYVGSSLVPRLLDLDYEVTVFDLFIYGNDVLPDHKNLKKILGDIRNTQLLKDNIPSDFIRSVTLNNIQIHIDKMKRLLDEIFLEYGVLNVNIDEVWGKVFLNKMLKTSQKFPENFNKDI